MRLWGFEVRVVNNMRLDEEELHTYEPYTLSLIPNYSV